MKAAHYRFVIFGYLAAAMVFIFAPTLSLIIFSFHAGKVLAFPIEGYSTRWYAVAWENRDIREGLANSLRIGIAVAPLATALGFASAHLLCRGKMKYRTLYIVGVSVPSVMPLLLSGLALLMYYQRIRLEGSLLGVIVAHTCYCSPFAMALIHNPYAGLNVELEQAARNLAAGPVRVLLQVTLPQLWPALAAAGIVSFVLSWNEFIIAWFIGGFTKTLPTVIYGMLGASYNPSLNAIGVIVMAVSTILFVLALVCETIAISKVHR